MVSEEWKNNQFVGINFRCFLIDVMKMVVVSVCVNGCNCQQVFIVFDMVVVVWCVRSDV